MNREIKKLWVDALRSGKYRKGKGYLKHTKSDGEVYYCCLGVLCELSPSEGRRLPDGVYEFRDGMSAYPPQEVKEWAGLVRDNPRVPWRGDTATLADINDNTEASFADIADLIEKEL
jgi:hypothetical protein